jgi:serine/threonine-protein kinase
VDLRFGEYELVSRLAAGGMGETFIARRVASAGVEKTVVIKKMLGALPAAERDVESFVEEARLASALSHRNIVQVFDFGQVEGEYFIAMEWIDGQSLSSVLRRVRQRGLTRLPFQVSVYLVIELLKGLQYAHSRSGDGGAPLGLVHRDVTPQNVLVSYDGEVKLVDFGIAKSNRAGRSETQPGLVKGKAHYMSPEQARGEPLDARSDLFATGVLLYELLTGARAFEGQLYTAMRAVISGDIVPPRVRAGDVPEPLEQVVLTAMAVDRTARFASALEMQQPLARWLFGQTPDFSAEVVREEMGVLFSEELAAQGRAFASKPDARRKLDTLSSPAVPAAVTPARRWPWALGAVACVVLGGAAAVVGNLSEAPPVKPPPPIPFARSAPAAPATALAAPPVPAPTPPPAPAAPPRADPPAMPLFEFVEAHKASLDACQYPGHASGATVDVSMEDGLAVLMRVVPLDAANRNCLADALRKWPVHPTYRRIVRITLKGRL